MLLRYSVRAGNRTIRPDDRRPGDLLRWAPVVTVLVFGGPIQAWLDWPRPARPEPTKQFWAASESGDASSLTGDASGA